MVAELLLEETTCFYRKREEERERKSAVRHAFLSLKILQIKYQYTQKNRMHIQVGTHNALIKVVRDKTVTSYGVPDAKTIQQIGNGWMIMESIFSPLNMEETEEHRSSILRLQPKAEEDEEETEDGDEDKEEDQVMDRDEIEQEESIKSEDESSDAEHNDEEEEDEEQQDIIENTFNIADAIYGYDIPDTSRVIVITKHGKIHIVETELNPQEKAVEEVEESHSASEEADHEAESLPIYSARKVASAQFPDSMKEISVAHIAHNNIYIGSSSQLLIFSMPDSWQTHTEGVCDMPQSIFTSKNAPNDRYNLPVHLKPEHIITTFCGSHVLVASEKKVFVFTPSKGRRPVSVLMPTGSRITCLCAHPSTTDFLFSDGGCCVGRMSLTGVLRGKYKGAVGSTSHLAVHKGGLWSVGLDRKLRCHDLEDRRVKSTVFVKSRASCVCVVPSPGDEEEEEEGDVWEGMDVLDEDEEDNEEEEE